MSFMSQISLSLDQLVQNISRLQEQANTLPSTTQVATVNGANQEEAQQQYRSALSHVLSDLAWKTEAVRMYVDLNAGRLQQAADALQSADGEQTLAARQATAFIEGVTADVASSTSGSSGGPSAGRPDADSTAW